MGRLGILVLKRSLELLTMRYALEVYNQLHSDLKSRAARLQGITDAISNKQCYWCGHEEISRFAHFLRRRQKEMAKLFAYVGTDGATFDAIWEHSARFHTYLAREEDLQNYLNRILKLANPVVFKVYKGLLLLQHTLTSEVYPIPGIREIVP